MTIAKLQPMDYKDLQKRAKELGIPYIGIPREELEKSIKEKETSSDVVAGDDELARLKQQSSKPSATAPAKEVSYNVASVLDGSREIRRYTRELHGENFVELANEFAKKKNYKVEMKSVKEGIKCPNCGYLIPVDNLL
jgi:hypothetical protein